MPEYFTTLNYALGDEDSAVEYQLLPEGTPRVAAVAGSGGRILPLLARQPGRLRCVDILEHQLHLTRLRVESAKVLNLDEFAAFWGYPPTPMTPKERRECFHSLEMPQYAAESLSTLFDQHGWTEIIYTGRFEQMLRSLARINHFFTGRAGRGLFDCQTVEQQVQYLGTSFPSFRWRLVLFLVANSTVLNSLLYQGEFPKKNLSGSIFYNFHRIYDQIFRDICVRESFFAQLSFFGRLITREAGLLEIDPAVFPAIKEALKHTRIEYVCADIIRHVGSSRDGWNFVSLSDVPSFLPVGTESGYLRELGPGLSAGGLVVARGNLRVIHPDTEGYADLTRSISDLSAKERTQLWQINVYKYLQDNESHH